MTLSVLTFFSGVRIEVGEFCLLGGLGYKINSSNTGLFSYPKSPNDSFGVNLLQWCENRSRRIL